MTLYFKKVKYFFKHIFNFFLLDTIFSKKPQKTGVFYFDKNLKKFIPNEKFCTRNRKKPIRNRFALPKNSGYPYPLRRGGMTFLKY